MITYIDHWMQKLDALDAAVHGSLIDGYYSTRITLWNSRL